jgi:hypothetical protein
MAQAKEEQALTDLVGRVFTDQAFARSLEQNPEQALKQAGFQLNAQQLRALESARAPHAALTGPDPAAVAAIVSPVVSVLTKGTRPVVQVVVSSAVVASAAEDNKTK